MVLEALDSDEAVAEAQKLGWFLRTPYLPPAEVLALGVRTARLARGDLELHLDWEELFSLVGFDPDPTLEIVELSLHAQLAKPHRYVPVDELRPILKELISAGNADTQSRAIRLVHSLGDAGYGDLGDLIN